MLSYEKEECSLTLREAYEEYLAANAFKGFFKPADLEEPLQSFFRNHDLIHIVFGLNTELHHEVLVDLWTFFGVDISLKDYLAFTRYPKVKDTLSSPSVLEMLGTVRVLPKAIKLFFKSRRLKKKWNWEPRDEVWNAPLSTLRRDFGIELVQ